MDNVDSSNEIEFDAFNVHYVIKLEANEGVNPSKLHHTNGIHGDEENQYFTSLKKPCHYFGKVINMDDEEINDNNNHAALSICDNRGIRGSIYLLNETLHIKPSKYWLDVDNIKDHIHDIKDEHLIYKFSDFDTTGIKHAEAIHLDKAKVLDIVENKRKTQEKNEQEFIDQAVGDDVNRRRLYNNGYNEVEMYLFIDPIRTKNYQSIGANWYQELVADHGDFMNQVSNQYSSFDWGSTIGEISVHWVELEVAFEFSVIYKSLYPRMSLTNCNNPFECEIDGNGYLEKFENFVRNYKDQSTFDNAQCWSDMNFSDASGWGSVGSVCTPSSVSNIAAIYSDVWSVRTAAHELGHNFGAMHDGQSGSGLACHEDDGLMGYGATSNTFSSCTLGSISTYFRSNNGLTCLGNGVRHNGQYFDSNYGGNIAPAAIRTPAPTAVTAQIVERTDNDGSCLTISNFEKSQGYDLNGDWSYDGEYNNAPYYSKDGSYLFVSPTHSLYVFNVALDDSGAVAYCEVSDIDSCNGKMRYLDTNNDWVLDADATINFHDCSDQAEGDNDNSCRYHNCIGVQSMEPTMDGISFDGDWTPNGCYNDESIYQFTTQGIMYYMYYMYLKEDYNYWYISATLGSDGPSAYCPKSELASCAHNWYTIKNNAWTQDSEVWIFDCAANKNPFTADAGVECKDNVINYNNKVCLKHDYFDGEENDGYTEWKRYNKTCSYNKPIYHFTIYDHAITQNSTESTIVNTTYYLHYAEVIKYTDSNETVPQWLISTDSISDVYYAKCEHEDLFQCEGLWEVKDTEKDDEILYILSNETMIYNEDCSVYLIAALSQNSSNNSTIILLSILVVLVIFVIIGVFLMVFCVKGTRSTENVQKAMEIPNDEEDKDEEEEIEVDVEIEVNDGQTTTYQ